MHYVYVSQPCSVTGASSGEDTSCIWHAEPHCFSVQGIDLEAGGRNKKTWRTAPKSENVYLKLLVKVRTAALLRLLWQVTLPQPGASPCWLARSSSSMLSLPSSLLRCISLLAAALQLPGEENRQQVQQGGAEAAIYVPDQQAAPVPLQAHKVHEKQGGHLTNLHST